MNDLIKEIATKSEFTERTLANNPDTIQRFADLLLNEVIDAISVQTNGFTTPEESIWRTTCINEIRKHFSIKVRGAV